MLIDIVLWYVLIRMMFYVMSNYHVMIQYEFVWQHVNFVLFWRSPIWSDDYIF